MVPFGTPREPFPARRRTETRRSERRRSAAVQYLRDIPTRQRFGQRTGMRRRKYGRSGVSPNRNASARASYAPVGFRLPLARPRFSSVHRANRSRRAAEQKRKSPRFIRSRRFPASTHPSAVLFGTPREPFPARRRIETQVSALHTLPSVSGFHSPDRGSLRYTARTVPGVPPSGNASLRASYAPVGFRLPLIHPRFSSVHRANRSRSAAEQERKSPRFIRSRRFPASTHPSAVLFGTPREPFPARRRIETQVSALHTLPSVSGFHSPVRACLRYTARTVPGAPPSRNA